MLKKTLKIIAWFLAIILLLAVILFVYFNWPVSDEKANTEARLGATFSLRYATDIGLDWKEVYLAVLDDLQVKKIRIPVYWDLVEKEKGQFDFTDVDWQLDEARKRDVEVILTIGQKVPRWPECFIPDWVGANDQKRKEALLEYLTVVVNRYKNNHQEIVYWQVENEPFLLFGDCPEFDVELLDSELALVRGLDPARPIIVSDSGELSFWVSAAKRSDVFGTTMYLNVYSERMGYHTYPIGPNFFQFKYWLTRTFARQKKTIVVELQAEPWVSGWTTNQPLEEQFKSMTAEKLAENVRFAQKVGFPEIYLWGTEWWYWMKTQKDHPEIWETAKTLFAQNSKS